MSKLASDMFQISLTFLATPPNPVLLFEGDGGRSPFDDPFCAVRPHGTKKETTCAWAKEGLAVPVACWPFFLVPSRFCLNRKAEKKSAQEFLNERPALSKRASAVGSILMCLYPSLLRRRYYEKDKGFRLTKRKWKGTQIQSRSVLICTKPERLPNRSLLFLKHTYLFQHEIIL